MVPFQPLAQPADFVPGISAGGGDGAQAPEVEQGVGEEEAEPEATLEDLLAEAKEEGRQEIMAQVAVERAQIQATQRQLMGLVDGVDGMREQLIVELYSK